MAKKTKETKKTKTAAKKTPVKKTPVKKPATKKTSVKKSPHFGRHFKPNYVHLDCFQSHLRRMRDF